MHRAVACLVLCLAVPAFAAEWGYPVLTVFRQEQHKGGTQNFDVTRDPRGRLYFSNSEGILIHDGAWWTRVPLPSASFNTVSDRNGRVGVTVLDDIGVLARGASGALEYQSLAPKIPPQLRDGMGQGQVCATSQGIVFATERFVAAWDGTNVRILESQGDAHTRRCFEFDGHMLLATWTGVVDLTSGKRTFDGKRVDVILRDMVILRNLGMFHADGTPYDTEASVWLRNKGVMDAKVLRDGRIAIATLRYGLLIMKSDGTIDQIIDAKAGLPNVFLFGVEQDEEGSLWLAMDTGMVRVDFASPVTFFDERLGLIGSVQALGRHNGAMYVGTSNGIFALDTPDNGRTRARKIPSPEANNPWSLFSSHGELLAGTYGALLVLHDDKPADVIEGTTDNTVFDIQPSRSDPDRLWLATEEGLATLRRMGNAWRYEGIVKNSPPYVHSVVEMPDGAVWFGMRTHGIARMTPDGTMTRYGSGDAALLLVSGRLVIVTDKGFFQPGPRGKLVRDPILGAIQPGESSFGAGADTRGNVWIATRPTRVVLRNPDGTYAREGLSPGAMEGDAMLFNGADADGVMWVGSERGLYRVAPLDARAMQRPPAPAIRRVVDGNQHLLFDGAVPGPAPAAPSLKHNFGRVRVEVAPLAYRTRTEYQYRLDPIDEGWSAWSEQAFLDYTNLGANDYTFRVRTRGAGGPTSDEATWTFSVLAPWYATRWAAALWTLLGMLALAGIVWLRTRTLRLRARRLQSLVDEQTVLLRDANQELERLSLADPLTGVANRRAFDRALSEAWKRAVRHDQSLAILMLDLDHFKVLNDSYGHTAGDECLRMVAQALENAIRGNGDDLVARWGGEEFVILLGDTNHANAVAVADRIRASVEALGITASIGVAIRAHDVDPTALIDRADRALYAAKHAGRNRVELDEERMSA